eukprot:CAMPEP_0168415518 /NCGR_PEP_ID=MMETSP0228-20121227/30273_1 /TAXON_ID=133427 /ORGANISM="Protoceratium reticulatum, Strain CCCM 535 (=CCMP 1889)" /LENGTH=120 /DNA_ID=CAMNT_0008429329 /DNA_START=9 /DNA_END=368 /DNA_ORIENTATION=+
MRVPVLVDPEGCGAEEGTQGFSGLRFEQESTDSPVITVLDAASAVTKADDVLVLTLPPIAIAAARQGSAAADELRRQSSSGSLGSHDSYGMRAVNRALRDHAFAWSACAPDAELPHAAQD